MSLRPGLGFVASVPSNGVRQGCQIKVGEEASWGLRSARSCLPVPHPSPVIRVMSSSGMTVFCLCYVISAKYELIPPGSVSWHPERWGLPLGICGPVDHVKHRLFTEMVLAPGKTLC